MKLYQTIACTAAGVAALALTAAACDTGTTTVKPVGTPSATPSLTLPTAPAVLPPNVGTTTSPSAKASATPSGTGTFPETPTPSNVVLNAKFGQSYALHYVNDYDFNHNAAPVYVDYHLLVKAPTTTRGALSQYGSPPTKGYYVVFWAAITAGPQSVNYNVMDFSVRNIAGESTSCGTGEDTLGSGTLHAGQTASGTIICDVKRADGTLVFDPSRVEDTGSLAEWSF